MNIYFIMSGCVSLLLALVHYFVGTPRVVKPINELDGLSARVKLLSHGSWQAVTIMLLAMAAAMFWSATHSGESALAIFVGAQAAFITVMCLVVIRNTDVRLIHTPQVFGFAIVAVTAALGLWA